MVGRTSADVHALDNSVDLMSALRAFTLLLVVHDAVLNLLATIQMLFELSR